MKANGDGSVAEYDDVEITFQQLTTSYRAKLISCTFRLEFIEQLWEQLDEITSNFFVARSQCQYLNKLRRFRDFAENICRYLWRFCRKFLLNSTR